jgi:hypothetical protein
VSDNKLEVHTWKVYWSGQNLTDGFYNSDHLVFCLLSEYMEIEIHKIVLLPVVLCGRIETGGVEENIWT